MLKAMTTISVIKFLTVVGALSLSTLAVAAPLCSQVFANEKPWILQQNHQVNTDFKTSKNGKNIEAWLKKLFNKPSYADYKELKDGSLLMIRRKSLTEPEELVLEKDKNEITLLKNTHYAKNNSFHFESLSVSQNEQFVAIKMNEKGSTDTFKVILFHIPSRQILTDQISTGPRDLYWRDDMLIYTSGKEQFVLDPKQALLKPQSLDLNVYEQHQDLHLALDANRKTLLYFNKNYHVLEGYFKSIVGQDGNSIYLKYDTAEEGFAIVKISKEDPRAKPTLVLHKKNAVVDNIELTKSYIVLRDHFGTRQSLQVFNKDGSELTTVDIPTGASVTFAKEIEASKKLQVILASEVLRRKEYILDPAKKEFEVPLAQIREEMLTDEKGQKYESYYTEVTSSDGTKIPVRLTHREDLAQNGQNPVLLNVYGGFEKSAGFYPRYIPTHAGFAAKGGVLANPALRGGDEFGKTWHKSATGLQKELTLDDLIATSRYLTKNQISSAQKIILWGNSNGGFVVSAAGLKSPQDFGLVISVNGVLDLTNTKTLDPKFADGWSRDYGDYNDANMLASMTRVSPLNLAKNAQTSPSFFILNGRQDSRVNSAHSYSFVEALQKAFPEKVQMLSLNNAGHFINSIAYQNLIGFRANVVVWTKIYDHLRWVREPEATEGNGANPG